MQGLLIVAIVFGVGFSTGYGVRALVSRRRHRRLPSQSLSEMQSELD